MDKYSRIKELGRGGFGAAILVCLRSDRSQQYVIKEVKINHMSRKEQEEAQREVGFLKTLHHSNIVEFVDDFVDRGKLCIVMGYADGGDLKQMLDKQQKRRKPLSEEEVLHYFVQICLALKHMHDKHILHRDLKSQNVFLTSKGIVKLGDFGIAKALGGTNGFARTQIGTPYYLSPEICNNRPYNRKSDIWSLGCLLYELMCMKVPFSGRDLPGLVRKIMTGSYTRPSKRYGRELQALLASLLQKDPKRRPTVNQMLKNPLMRKAIQKFAVQLQSRKFGDPLVAAARPSPAPAPAAASHHDGRGHHGAGAGSHRGGAGAGGAGADDGGYKPAYAASPAGGGGDRRGSRDRHGRGDRSVRDRERERERERDRQAGRDAASAYRRRSSADRDAAAGAAGGGGVGSWAADVEAEKERQREAARRRVAEAKVRADRERKVRALQLQRDKERLRKAREHRERVDALAAGARAKEKEVAKREYDAWLKREKAREAELESRAKAMQAQAIEARRRLRAEREKVHADAYNEKRAELQDDYHRRQAAARKNRNRAEAGLYGRAGGAKARPEWQRLDETAAVEAAAAAGPVGGPRGGRGIGGRGDAREAAALQKEREAAYWEARAAADRVRARVEGGLYGDNPARVGRVAPADGSHHPGSPEARGARASAADARRAAERKAKADAMAKYEEQLAAARREAYEDRQRMRRRNMPGKYDPTPYAVDDGAGGAAAAAGGAAGGDGGGDGPEEELGVTVLPGAKYGDGGRFGGGAGGRGAGGGAPGARRARSVEDVRRAKEAEKEAKIAEHKAMLAEVSRQNARERRELQQRMKRRAAEASGAAAPTAGDGAAGGDAGPGSASGDAGRAAARPNPIEARRAREAKRRADHEAALKEAREEARRGRRALRAKHGRGSDAAGADSDSKAGSGDPRKKLDSLVESSRREREERAKLADGLLRGDDVGAGAALAGGKEDDAPISLAEAAARRRGRRPKAKAKAAAKPSTDVHAAQADLAKVEQVADDAFRAAFAQGMLAGVGGESKKPAASAAGPVAPGTKRAAADAKADLHEWLRDETVALSDADLQDARYEAELEDLADDLANILAMNDAGDDGDDDDWDAMPLVSRMASEKTVQELKLPTAAEIAAAEAAAESKAAPAPVPSPKKRDPRTPTSAPAASASAGGAPARARATSDGSSGSGAPGVGAREASSPEVVERLRSYLQDRVGEENLVAAYAATKRALERATSHRALVAELKPLFRGDELRVNKYQPLIQRLVEEDELLAASQR